MLKSQGSTYGLLGSRRLRKPWNASYGSCHHQRLFDLGLGFCTGLSLANYNLLVLKIQHSRFLVYYASKSTWASYNFHDPNFNIVILFSANHFCHFHLCVEFSSGYHTPGGVSAKCYSTRRSINRNFYFA